MQTALLFHPVFRQHDMGGGHPESPLRLDAIADQLRAQRLDELLLHVTAPYATRAQLLRVHSERHVAGIEARAPEAGLVSLDPDTSMNPHTLDAALRAAGAVADAVDRVLAGQARNAFCCVRPPGHHATRDRAMGFCLFNNVAVGAAQALAAHGLQRVAILDFDVHHGNGTHDIFADEPRVLLCSSYQHPWYPYVDLPSVPGHIISSPLAAGSDGRAFRAVVERDWLPALEEFAPEMIFLSAGFDAHRDDPLAGLRLVEDDYVWITRQALQLAERFAQGRVVSTLEGGYHLRALAASAAAHVRTLMGV